MERSHLPANLAKAEISFIVQKSTGIIALHIFHIDSESQLSLIQPLIADKWPDISFAIVTEDHTDNARSRKQVPRVLEHSKLLLKVTYQKAASIIKPFLNGPEHASQGRLRILYGVRGFGTSQGGFLCISSLHGPTLSRCQNRRMNKSINQREDEKFSGERCTESRNLMVENQRRGDFVVGNGL